MKLLKKTLVYRGSTVAAPTPATYTGYNFTGWDKSLTNVQSNMDVLTQYVLKTYTVTFKYNNTVYDTQTVQHGSTVRYAGSPMPVQTGYNFVWNDPGTITQNTVVSGGYYRSDGWFKVTFKNGNTELKTQWVQSGNSATPPSDPTASGYIFQGWSPSYTNILKDTVCIAQFTKINTTFTLKGSNSTGNANKNVVDISVDYQISEIPNKTLQVTSGNKNLAPFTNIAKKYLIYACDNANTDGITAIGAKCFTGTSYAKYLKTAVFPSVTTIGEKAFYQCTYLKTVTFPKVTTIGTNAFSNCFTKSESSVSLVFPKLTSVSKQMFRNSTKLASFSAAELTSVGDQAFQKCKNLQTVSLPSVTTIGASAFTLCQTLTTLDIHSVTTIGASAFLCNTSGCGYCADAANTSLKTLNIPNATSIGKNAFDGLNGVTSLTLKSTWNGNLPSDLWGLGKQKSGQWKNGSGGVITITYS